MQPPTPAEDSPSFPRKFILHGRRLLGRVYHTIRRAIRPTRWEQHIEPIVRWETRELGKARTLYGGLYDDPHENPLITVTIATYNRGRLLLERAIASLLKQTYTNFEVVIVGDHCTDDTEHLLTKLNDPRIRWVNLPVRGSYPLDAKAHWQVAGTVPMNEAKRLARGKWISPLDDDDVYTHDHLEVLLREAQAKNLEMVYGLARREAEPGRWEDKGGPANGGFSIPGEMIFRTYLRLFASKTDAYLFDIPWDKHLRYRFQRAGIREGFLDRVVVLSPMRPGQTKFDWRAEDRLL
jgi:glycosyltransferase involved in cell wall biosynthesis